MAQPHETRSIPTEALREGPENDVLSLREHLIQICRDTFTRADYERTQDQRDLFYQTANTMCAGLSFDRSTVERAIKALLEHTCFEHAKLIYVQKTEQLYGIEMGTRPHSYKIKFGYEDDQLVLKFQKVVMPDNQST